MFSPILGTSSESLQSNLVSKGPSHALRNGLHAPQPSARSFFSYPKRRYHVTLSLAFLLVTNTGFYQSKQGMLKVE